MLAAMIATVAIPTLSIIPVPAQVVEKDGSPFTVQQKTKIVATGIALPVAQMLGERLRMVTGYGIPITDKATKGDIVFSLDPKLAKEAYSLGCGPDRLTIQASSAAGFFYGMQTLYQLLPHEVYGKKRADVLWAVPAISIMDGPRFSWRGGHLDVGRHYMPLADVKKFIDLLALHKMNVFHWHLTDDQGWRIEIKKYPKLTSVGGFRKDTMTNYSPAQFTGEPHGGFYTQEEVREVVAYAAERYITVVPEIEMPGHAQAAIAAYPELGNFPDQQLEVFTKWGVNENVFNTEDSTIRFLQDVLDEVMALFPSPFIHIGGDECPKKQWKESPRVQAKMKELGIKDEHGMQSWFIGQMDKYLAAKGRRLIGWSEILEGGLAPGAALMVWLGNDGALEAVGSGHDVVMAQTSHTYLDYYQGRDRNKEPKAIGGYLPLWQVYRYDPILPQMSPEQAKHVMGAQFQIWTEYISNFKKVEYMAYPRASALAEVAWSPVSKRDFSDFRERLTYHMRRLDELDVNYRYAPATEAPLASWSPKEVSTNPQPMVWDVDQRIPAGKYELEFVFSSGAHALAFSQVDVLVAGVSVLSQAVDGFAGGKPRNTKFPVTLNNPGRKLSIRIIGRGDGGTDSRGDIFLTPKG